MGTEMEIFLTFSGTLILIVLLGRTLLIPAKILFKVLLNSLLGGIVLIVLNFVGMYFGVFIPVNVINSVAVGILGIPGVILLLLFFV